MKAKFLFAFVMIIMLYTTAQTALAAEPQTLTINDPRGTFHVTEFIGYEWIPIRKPGGSVRMSLAVFVHGGVGAEFIVMDIEGSENIRSTLISPGNMAFGVRNYFSPNPFMLMEYFGFYFATLNMNDPDHAEIAERLSANESFAVPSLGEVIGEVLHSDIIARINGYAIPSSINSDGWLLVAAEDLHNYGFEVSWVEQLRHLEISRSAISVYDTVFYPIAFVEATAPIGSFKQNFYFTDIVTFIVCDEQTIPIRSYSLDGYMLIYFDDLSVFGDITWCGETRELHLELN
ncbi:MAG: hypothetical protein FWC95_02770 [Defluviitaleaceae bacterium]|nr:hypothetical protein [Defluviitaleaceae bacterium]